MGVAGPRCGTAPAPVSVRLSGVSRPTLLRLVVGCSLVVGLLTAAVWVLVAPDDTAASDPASGTAERPTPTAPASTPPAATPTPATPTPTPSATPSVTPSARPTRTTPTRTPTRTTAAHPRTPADPTTDPSPTATSRATPTAPAERGDDREDRAERSGTTDRRPPLPGPIHFAPVDLDRVCNRHSSFTLAWSPATNAETYHVSVFGSSLADSYRGSETSMTVPCPRVAGTVQVQGYASNGTQQSDYSHASFTYSAPLDEQTPFRTVPERQYARTATPTP